MNSTTIIEQDIDGCARELPANRVSAPLHIVNRVTGATLPEWAKRNRSIWEAGLRERGSVVFRGFQVRDSARFETAAAVLCGELFKENGEHVPVVNTRGVQTPVAYSPRHKLLWHNENSFNRTWPLKICFCCSLNPGVGGETPVVDSRLVAAQLPAALVRDFVEKGVLYVRKYRTEIGLSWQRVFGVTDRSAVERICREDRVRFEWKSDGGLTTYARRPAVINHPVTGERSWFNQAQHWHTGCLDLQVKESLLAILGKEEDLPRGCFYGDGSRIPDEVMAEICAVYEANEYAARWEEGDVMLVDNVLAAHARNPYKGERRLFVALGEPQRYADADLEP